MFDRNNKQRIVQDDIDDPHRGGRWFKILGNCDYVIYIWSLIDVKSERRRLPFYLYNVLLLTTSKSLTVILRPFLKTTQFFFLVLKHYLGFWPFYSHFLVLEKKSNKHEKIQDVLLSKIMSFSFFFFFGKSFLKKKKTYPEVFCWISLLYIRDIFP